MNYKILKRALFLTVLLPFSSYMVSDAEEISNDELNQLNTDKIRASSGIDYIVLPNGEKVYSENATYTVYENGIYIFSVYDRVGNSEIVKVEISNIDTKPPSLNLNKVVEEDGYCQIYVSGADSESGISHIILPNGERVEGDKAKFKVLKNGIYTFQIYDVAGNVTEQTLSENMLNLSLNTNAIIFEDFNGIEDIEKTNTIGLTVNSSLPYDINAYLPTEIQNSDKSNTMDKSILNIKESSQLNYQTFSNITDKIILKENNPAGNSLQHWIDIKLKGSIAHEKDIYKTTIKIEVVQK